MRGFLAVCAAVAIGVGVGVAVVASLQPPSSTVTQVPGLLAVAGNQTYVRVDALQLLDCPDASECLGSDGSTIEDITAGGTTWQRAVLPRSFAASNVDLVALTCASAKRCWAGGAQHGGAGYVISTTDGGYLWRAVPLPRSTGAVQDLSCPSRSWCMAVTTRDGAWVALVTRDGGNSWYEHDLGPGAGDASSISCPAPRTCWFASNPRTVPVLKRTTDGGVHWHTLAAPSAERSSARPAPIESLDCVNASSCFVSLGQRSGDVVLPGGPVLATSNAGRSWRTMAVPAQMTSSGAYELSCTGPTRCAIAAGHEFALSTDGGRHWTSRGVGDGKWLVPPPLTALSCAPDGACAVAAGVISADVLAVTSDGGRSWTSGEAPGDVVAQTVQCAPRSACVVGNQEVGETPAIEVASPSTGTDVVPRLSGGWDNVLAIDAPSALPGASPTCGSLVCTLLAVMRGLPHHTVAILVSTSAARDWHVIYLPRVSVGLLDIEATCTSTRHCLAFWFTHTQTGQASMEFLETSDAGQSWQHWSTSIPTGDVDAMGPRVLAIDILCSSKSRCIIFETTDFELNNTLTPWLDVTTDGGHHWSAVALPAQPFGTLFSRCDDRGDCALVGYPSYAGPGAVELLLSSTDSGASWRTRFLPPALHLDEAPECSSASSCWAGAMLNGHPAVASTMDGGAQWSARMLKTETDALAGARYLRVSSVSCAAPSACAEVAAGQGDASNISAVIMFSRQDANR